MITDKEKQILLILFKDFRTRYNARSLSLKIAMTPRGTLKALKALEKQKLVAAERFGKAIQYTYNLRSLLAKKTIELFLLEEAEFKYKRWMEEFKKFDEADILILFGSIVRMERYNDVDLLIVVKKKRYKALKKKIDEKNGILIKKIHPLFQTRRDLQENIKRKDPVIIDAIKTGIVLKGWTAFIEVMENVSKS